jgi:hypothetical protein
MVIVRLAGRASSPLLESTRNVQRAELGDGVGDRLIETQLARYWLSKHRDRG